MKYRLIFDLGLQCISLRMNSDETKFYRRVNYLPAGQGFSTNFMTCFRISESMKKATIFMTVTL